MKKLLFLAALCCFCAGVASAQMIEIVQLKNGSRIRGIITEQVPNKHLKIQMSDGSVFVYSYDEIEKISKEMPQQKNRSAYTYEQNRVRQERIDPAFRPRYEGSVDVGYSIGVSAIDGTGRVHLSTSHGCRLIPYLYVGAGAEFDYYHTGSGYGIPIFADFRGYFTQQAVKPFLNLRIGYSVGDVEGLYFSPAAGINFKKLDISLGYTYQKADVILYEPDWGFWATTANVGAVTIKVGLHF